MHCTCNAYLVELDYQTTVMGVNCMEKQKDSIYCKGYRNGYLDGYRDGILAAQTGEYRKYSENEMMNLPIEAMEITTRAHNCLVRLGCRYISDLLELREENLQRARNMGSKTAAEIAGWLEQNGFSHSVWSRYL